jgi:hypothetical protein
MSQSKKLIAKKKKRKKKLQLEGNAQLLNMSKRKKEKVRPPKCML